MTTQQMDDLDNLRQCHTGYNTEMTDDVTILLYGINALMAREEDGEKVIVWHEHGKKTIWPGDVLQDLYDRVEANASRIGALL